MAWRSKSIPVCPHCGRFTCADCGEGFDRRSDYLAHRVDPSGHAARRRPARRGERA